MGKKSEPSPQELRKIEKDRRRKRFEDLQVQGTNNSSIVSKRSVEKIYKSVCPPGEWFKHFVPKGKRRSPAINRGYWIRMEAIRRMVYRIVESEPLKAINIINLGCGFDPLPFQLLSMGHDMTFYDIDYPDLVANKKEMILKLDEIMSLIGEDKGGDWLMNCDKYKLIGCDLKNHSYFAEQLKKLNQGVNIFIAEVSLAYMHYDDANKIISHSSEVPDSHFLILEQILPVGTDESFAQKMLAHFKKLRSSLKCVEQYPLKEDQVQRFKQYYKNVEIKDLFENWIDLIDNTLKHQVDMVEDFDEWEEFILFCQHYVVVHATNGSLVYKEENKTFGPTPVEDLNIELDQMKLLDLKFPASYATDTDVYTNGGLDQTRSDKTFKNGEVVSTEGPPARMCHSFTNGVLVGGRQRPGLSLSDVWQWNPSNNSWLQLKPLPVGVARHDVIFLGKEEILVLGGQVLKGNLIAYNLKTQTHRAVKCNGDFDFSTLAGFGCTYDSNTNVGYIIGGQTNKELPKFSSKLFKFSIKNDEFSYEEVKEDLNFERFGCKLVEQKNALLLIGGINYNEILGQSNTIVKIDLSSFDITYMKIPDQIWKLASPLMIGHNVVSQPNSVRILHGGAVCYSFGSTYNHNYIIRS